MAHGRTVVPRASTLVGALVHTYMAACMGGRFYMLVPLYIWNSVLRRGLMRTGLSHWRGGGILHVPPPQPSPPWRRRSPRPRDARAASPAADAEPEEGGSNTTIHTHYSLTLVPHRGFAISEFAKKRPETFVKRTFARWRALPLRRDLARVRHDAMRWVLRARELAPVCL